MTAILMFHNCERQCHFRPFFRPDVTVMVDWEFLFQQSYTLNDSYLVIVYTLRQFVLEKDDIPHVYVLSDEMKLNHAEMETKAGQY